MPPLTIQRPAPTAATNRMRWRGVWLAGTYALNDVVAHGDLTMICINPAGTATEPATAAPDWDLVADNATGGGGGSYTDEQAQDAVGAMLLDTSTVDFTYADATPALSADVRRQMSITADASGLLLLGDVAAPGNAFYYGTNGAGVKGWHLLPVPPAAYSDEQAQDAVGAMLVDTATIDFTYTDAIPSLTADVKDASIIYAKLQNVSATDRILGRQTAGAGVIEELVCTPLARSLLDDTTQAAMQSTLGLGTMATQNASAVAITDGRISLGGHAPTGVLDVQGSVARSDVANGYISVRTWPVAPSGALYVTGLQIEGITGAGLATARLSAIYIADQSASLVNVYGLNSDISSGTGRYNIHAPGNAQNYFGGNVGIGNSAPSYPLDVTGHARVTGNLALGGVPSGTDYLTVRHDRSTSFNGVAIRASVSDAGGYGVVLTNVAGSIVGSITYTSSATAFNTSSDARLKHAVQALTGALDAVRALRPVSFVWNSTDQKDIGFLAHELMTVAPNAVTGLPDEVNLDGTIKPQQVDQSKLVPILVAAVKELLARVEVLEQALA